MVNINLTHNYMTKILLYLRDFYSGIAALLFTAVVSLPGLIVATMIAGWIAKILVWAFLFLFE